MGEPRIVVVHRETEYASLLCDHGTKGKASFFLESRGRDIDEAVARHTLQERALGAVLKAVPGRWRRARVERSDLDRFLFEPDDIVVPVGQDGLVANASKYLVGQPVVGVNPDPERNPGVLVPFAPDVAGSVIAAAADGAAHLQRRTMVEVETDDGQRLLALNELFFGHRTHQSARYDLRIRGRRVHQSSSGLIVATGTGATGWARSIHTCRHSGVRLPRPTDPALVFFVREPWPGPGCDVELNEGLLSDGATLRLVSRMGEGGVIFGDGIEEDRIPLRWGQAVELRRAERTLNLVAPPAAKRRSRRKRSARVDPEHAAVRAHRRSA